MKANNNGEGIRRDEKPIAKSCEKEKKKNQQKRRRKKTIEGGERTGKMSRNGNETN